MIASQARMKSKLIEKGATLPSAPMRRKQVSGSTEASALLSDPSRLATEVQGCAGPLLAIVDFASTYSHALSLAPFSLEDLRAAPRPDVPSPYVARHKRALRPPLTVS